MVLLHGVASLRAERDVTVEVAHVDHALRKESGADAEFVRAASAALDLRCHVRRLTPPSAGENIEAWGRKHRYAFFTELRQARGLGLALTAHTADDVAETLLMRLVSNKELRTIRRYDGDAGLLRPLLEVTREEITRYALEFGVSWREDGSNREVHLLRNRVRHELVPALKRFDERVVEVLALRAAAVAEDDGYIEDVVRAMLGGVSGAWGSREWLGGVRALLANAPGAVRWRIGEQVVFSKLGFRLGRVHGERVADFILGNGAVLELPSNRVLRRREGGLCFEIPGEWGGTNGEP